MNRGISVKKVILGLLVSSSFAFAHGPIAHQASEAVESASKVFLAAQPKEITKQFFSVNAEITGVEKFRVVITLQDKTTQFSFDCAENELVSPEVWECEAL